MQFAGGGDGGGDGGGESKEGREGDAADNPDLRCPWPVAEVTRAESTVRDDELTPCILAYAKVSPIFRDRFDITPSDGADALQQRGRDSLVRCYKEIERACNPFLPAMEGARRRAECAEMERENRMAAAPGRGDAGQNTSHAIAVRCFGQIEETLDHLCVRNNLRGRAQGLGGYAANLQRGRRITDALLDRLKRAGQFRNVNLGHEAQGAAQGIVVRAKKTSEFLRLYRDLLQESTKVPIREQHPEDDYTVSELMPRGIALILNVVQKREGAK